MSEYLVCAAAAQGRRKAQTQRSLQDPGFPLGTPLEISCKPQRPRAILKEESKDKAEKPLIRLATSTLLSVLLPWLCSPLSLTRDHRAARVHQPAASHALRAAPPPHLPRFQPPLDGSTHLCDLRHQPGTPKPEPGTRFAHE